MLAAKKPGERFSRVVEGAEEYMKRLFVKDKDQIAKRGALEVQTAQQSKDFDEAKSGGGRKRSHDEGCEVTAARLRKAGLRKSGKPPKRDTGRNSSRTSYYGGT